MVFIAYKCIKCTFKQAYPPYTTTNIPFLWPLWCRDAVMPLPWCDGTVVWERSLSPCVCSCWLICRWSFLERADPNAAVSSETVWNRDDGTVDSSVSDYNKIAKTYKVVCLNFYCLRASWTQKGSAHSHWLAPGAPWGEKEARRWLPSQESLLSPGAASPCCCPLGMPAQRRMEYFFSLKTYRGSDVLFLFTAILQEGQSRSMSAGSPGGGSAVTASVSAWSWGLFVWGVSELLPPPSFQSAPWRPVEELSRCYQL